MVDYGECDACEGRGSFKIDPNAKYMTWDELIASCEKTAVKVDEGK